MIRFGCQTNVWKREQDSGKSFWDVLDEVEETGCEGIESGWWQIGPVCDDLPRLKDELAGRGLRQVSIFSVVSKWAPDERDQERADLERNCTVLEELGASIAALGTGDAERTPESFELVAEVLNDCGQIAIDHGLKLSLHPHGIAGGPEDWEVLTDLCLPQLVSYCPDLGNLDMYGGDALEFCEQYFDRINYVHFKDYSGGGQSFVPLGQGTSQIAECIGMLKSKGFSGWMMIEHETPHAKEVGAKAAIRQDLEYVKSML